MKELKSLTTAVFLFLYYLLAQTSSSIVNDQISLDMFCCHFIYTTTEKDIPIDCNNSHNLTQALGFHAYLDTKKMKIASRTDKEIKQI